MEEDGELDPLIPPDEDDENTTQPFQPGGHSTPGPSGEEIPMTTFNRGKEKGPGWAETSFIEGRNPDSAKIEIPNMTLEKNFPEYVKDGKRLILEVSKKYIFWQSCCHWS